MGRRRRGTYRKKGGLNLKRKVAHRYGVKMAAGAAPPTPTPTQPRDRYFRDV
jgi:hypothetical protein